MYFPEMPSNSRAAVYLAECVDFAGNTYAKVGLTGDVLKRLPVLQVGCPLEFSRVRFVYLPTRALAARAEKRCHVALKKYHLRGEWFYVAAGDDVARTAIDCFSDVVAVVAKGPVRVGSLDMTVIYITNQRPFRAFVFWRGNERRTCLRDCGRTGKRWSARLHG